MKPTLIFRVLLLYFVLLAMPLSADNSAWVLVDTEKLTLEVRKGNKLLTVMENISIGRNGAGFKNRRGDDITPKGSYKIGWINEKSSFYRFYGLNYPSVENAHEALLSGLLSKKSHTAIINAHQNNQLPPQNTKIGGRIGIHGLGAADKAIHNIMNWTHGCVALNNEQLDKLDKWIGKGTVVIIK